MIPMAPTSRRCARKALPGFAAPMPLGLLRKAARAGGTALLVLAGLTAWPLDDADVFMATPALAQHMEARPPERLETRRAPLMIETDSGIVTLDVEIADTPALRRRGLMFRQRLPRGRGMLLLWPRPSMAALWMKNTLIPLDMVFIDAGGRIVHIHENAQPGDLTPVAPGRPVIAVLEIPAGEARRLGLRTGLRVSLPRTSR